LKVFAIVGILITVVIIGFMAAMYLNSAVAPVTVVPEVETPYGTVGGGSNPANAIDLARGIASMDRERQQEMQKIVDNLGGANANP